MVLQAAHFFLFLAVSGYGIYLFAKAVYHRYLYLKARDIAKIVEQSVFGNNR